jgi:hypothetical protein
MRWLSTKGSPQALESLEKTTGSDLLAIGGVRRRRRREMLALENGKTKPQAQLEVDVAPETLRFNAALALTDNGRAPYVTVTTMAGLFISVLRTPITQGSGGRFVAWKFSPARARDG